MIRFTRSALFCFSHVSVFVTQSRNAVIRTLSTRFGIWVLSQENIPMVRLQLSGCRLQAAGCRANEIKQVRPMNLIPVQLQAPGSNRATGLMKASLTTSQPAVSREGIEPPTPEGTCFTDRPDNQSSNRLVINIARAGVEPANTKV